MRERRKENRHNLVDIVRYAPVPHFSNTYLTGVMQNYSHSGLCFITHHTLEDVEEIELKRGSLSKAKKSVVRWHEDIGNGNHNVGVEHVKA